IRCEMRCVMTRVFPLPAPARINTGPSVVATASRCWGFRPERKSTNELFYWTDHYVGQIPTLVRSHIGQIIHWIKVAYIKVASLEELGAGELLEVEINNELFAI